MENSKIEWTDHTFNPWIGCTKVSDGCKNCYAETLMDKRWGKVEWGPAGKRLRTSVANWKNPLAWNKKSETRAKVFCASLADVFEEKLDQPEMVGWRADLLALIEDTPHLDWLLLTKRPENVMRLVNEARGDVVERLPDNVWIGTSVENQEQADLRIPHLLAVPARVRFLSMEPLLGAVDLNLAHQFVPIMGDPLANSLMHQAIDDGRGWARCGIHQVIVGGESGHGARPMNPNWVRSIRDQCVEADVPFFFKQWGEWMPMESGHKRKRIGTFADGKFHDGIWMADGTCVQNVGKGKAGRLLDGVLWNEFPKEV